MKIGLVLDDTLDSSDGVQQYVITLGSWLSSQGYDVHYLVGQTERTDIKNIHSLAKNFKVKFNKNVLSIPSQSSSAAIKQLLSQEQFDVLHVQMPFSPLLAGKIIKYAPSSTKIVGTFHILPYSNLQHIGAKGLSWITKSAHRRFATVVSVSPGAQQFALNAMGIKSEVIPNAVNLANFGKPQKHSATSAVNTKDLKIVFLGRLVQRKGCRELLQAINRLHESGLLKETNTQVIIAGDGPDRQSLEKYVASHDLGSRVEFLGRITEEYKPVLLASADIVALPSISGESFGIVVVEAIASGAGVVVGGDNPGYSYVLSATPETLINPKDTAVFSKLLKDLIQDQPLRTKLVNLQRNSIAKFDVNVIGKQIVDVYKSVIAKK